ncbi:Type-1 fimbrial protein, A chain precursor [compost metagenome]
MNKFSLAFLAMSVIAASGSALAATPAGGGQISFTGEINNDACSVEGTTGKNKTIAFDLGNVSLKDMGTDTDPGAGRLSASDINLNLNCNAGTKVTMQFDATKGGATVVPGKKVLGLQGSDSAKGVGIAIMDQSGQVIDLATPASAVISSNLNNGDATLAFSAAYVKTTDDVAALKAGSGNAILPFTLSYE